MRSFRSVLGLTVGKALTTHSAMCWRTCQYVAFNGKDAETDEKGQKNKETGVR